MGHVVRRLIEMHGLDAAGLAHEAGFDLAAVREPAERIDTDRLDAVLRLAIPLIDDPSFGLQAARCWHPANLGVLGHAWLTCSTLRSGLSRMARYFRLIGERGAIEIEDTAEGVEVRFWAKRGNPATVAVAAVIVDMAMAVLLDMCRMNAGAALRPLTARLRRGIPAHPEAYRRFFGCAVRFGAEENAFVLSTEEADQLLPSANRQLAAVFDRMLAEELARLDRHDVVARCRAAVLEQLASGETSTPNTAQRLHMSARTLQRKLAAARTTYEQLVDDARKDLALRYMADPQRSITDITFSLGFSQPSAFTRAFRRWTGASPTDFRTRAAASR
jgi:AraC-like DNA-binding protein